MKYSVHFLLLCLLSPFASADALIDVYRKALKKDPGFSAAQATNQASHERKAQAKSFLYPNISAQINSNKIDTDALDFRQDRYALRLNQPLFNKRTLHGLRQTEHLIKSADHGLAQAKQQLITRVTQAYFDVLLAKDTVQAARSESSAIATQLQHVQQQFDIGTATITDVSETRARKDAAVFNLLSAENSLQSSNEALRAIIGEVPAYLRPLKTQIPLLVPAPASAEAWVKLALKHSATIAGQHSSSKAAKEEVHIQKSGHYPVLSLVGEISKTETDISTSSSEKNTSVGLQLDIPLFQGGFVNSRVREARHKYKAATLEFEQSKRETQRLVRDLFATIEADIKRIRAAKQLLHSSQTALNAAQEGFDAGTRTSLDVLNARSELFNAKLSWARSRYDYLHRTLQLKAAAGVLTEKDLHTLSKLLR